MFTLETILRPHILSLTPYSSARDEYTGKEGIFLDANENALGSTTSTNYNRYPDPYQWAIKERLAPLKGVRPEQIFLGNGSDEPIDLLIRATCTPEKDSVLIMPPTYGMYEVSANINNVPLIKVPLTPDFQIDLPEVLAAIQPDTKLLFVCSPNNPTGNLIDRQSMLTLLEKFTGLVVVDEAYIDFADAGSMTALLDRYSNLVVLQTFSKAWGLAALRLGMCFASAALIRVLNKIKPPYNISAPTQELALEALSHVTQKEEMVAKLLAERAILTEHLRSLPLVQQVYPSDANFLLVRFDRPGGPDAKTVFDYLISRQVIVRDRSKVKLCEGCLRITVGTPHENSQLLDVLHQMMVPVQSYS
ncbi:histidinol-phosphate transaminase [Nibrella viscosa]|uniref:Histidinol-phosphate aminotransferase n=1 Tax=Nibrella viscosa TaxID=1084524 RepID=A0ABP8JYD7_9BACT